MALPVLESFTGPTFEDTVIDNKLTLTTPAGTVQNDLLVAQVSCDDATVSYPADDDSGAGWKLEIELGFEAISCAIYCLKAPASPAATYVFDANGNTVMGGGMARISGAHATAPIDVAGFASGDTAASVDCPDIPSTVIDTLILRLFAADDDDYPDAGGYPTDHTGLYADETTLGNGMSVGAAHIDQAGIGDTGIGRFTGMTPAEQWVGFTLAIAPSVGAAGAVTIDRINGGPFSALVTAASVEGISFEAVKGTGSVKISPTDDVDDAGAVTQTDTNWTADEITFSIVRGALSLDTNVYLFVTNDTGDSNLAGFVLQLVPEYTLDFAQQVGVIFNATFSQIPAPPINPVSDLNRAHPWFYPRW